MNLAILSLLALTLGADEPAALLSFRITVVDEVTGRGVPLIELRTVNEVRYITDSHGNIAFHEPGLMGQPVFFHVTGHGYEMPADGFGFRGVRVTPRGGQSHQIRIRRINVAERLYRITGAGIYADTVQLGLPAPIRHPLLNAQVMGSDSVQAAVMGDRIYWFWGDTNRPSYPLGLFQAPGATSRLPEQGGLAPADGIDLEYFVGDDGFAKATCFMPGEGPTWIDGIAAIVDSRPSLFAHYVKVKPPLTIYQHGIAEFDEAEQKFIPRSTFPPDAVVLPGGHTFQRPTPDDSHVYFAKPFPVVRVAADRRAIVSAETYEAYSCLKVGSRESDPQLDRDEYGVLRYGWKRDTPPLTLKLQRELVEQGGLRADECLYQLQDMETERPVTMHNGSVQWNPFRERWILIASEVNGTSHLGEVWYAEAPTMHGPWRFARKIVTHDRQSFYNPCHHPFFDENEGKQIYFEGTYTHTFSGSAAKTPRYEYNQIMYRLTLEDSRLKLPVPIYLGGSRQAPLGNDGTFRAVRWFAFDRPVEGSVPVFAEGDQAEPIFYGLDAKHARGRAGCVRLSELTSEKVPECFVWKPVSP